MSTPMRAAVNDLCARLGANSLLVQGAGGNASWKDGDTLFVKASGTWLADAGRDDIFVPVDLAGLRQALAGGDFAVTPLALPGASLRPSIETVLHALMPQPVVLHVHAIDVLALLVREDWQAAIEARLPADIGAIFVPYRKPGAELAAAVAQALPAQPVQVVFLQSHGLVVGADSADAVSALLERLLEALRQQPRPALAPAALPLPRQLAAHYTALPQLQVHALATSAHLWRRVQDDWALYPDHVVFLGDAAHCYASEEALALALAAGEAAPELVLVQDVGIFIRDSFGIAKQAQLQCYYDVICRQDAQTRLHALELSDIAALLNWESEKYRMMLAK